MADITTTLVNEIRTLDDYRQACMLVQHRIQAGQEVSSSVIHALAVKGHLLTRQQPTLAATVVPAAFLSVHQAEPGILEDNVSDDRG